jgi:nucleotide-binding universal stress UspA family protein
MFQLRHILFPVDFSERSSAAAPFVAAVARRFDSDVTLLHVVSTLEYVPLGGVAEAGYYVDPEAIRQQRTRELNQFNQAQFGGMRTECRLADGSPADEIVRIAHETGSALVMMPSHGYGPFRRLLLGSVTAKVLHDVECAVWTGAHVETPPIKEHIQCRRVLCALGLSSRNPCVLKWAAEYAKAFSADLRIVHALPDFSDPVAMYTSPEFKEEMKRLARERIVKVLESAGADAPICIEFGEVADVIHHDALEHKADLVVIGRGAIQEKLGRLRTNAYGIIRHAPCPVISV